MKAVLQRSFRLLAITALVMLPQISQSQSTFYPSKPIRLVDAFSAVTLLGRAPSVAVVNAESSIKSGADFLIKNKEK